MLSDQVYNFGIDGVYTHGIEGMLSIGVGYDSHPEFLFEGTFEDLLEWVVSIEGEHLAGDVPVDTIELNLGDLTVSVGDLVDEKEEDDDIIYTNEINDMLDMFDSAGIKVELT